MFDREELERRRKINLETMRADTKKIRENSEPLPIDTPRFGSFAEDDPETHESLRRKE